MRAAEQLAADSSAGADDEELTDWIRLVAAFFANGSMQAGTSLAKRVLARTEGRSLPEALAFKRELLGDVVAIAEVQPPPWLLAALAKGAARGRPAVARKSLRAKACAAPARAVAMAELVRREAPRFAAAADVLTEVGIPNLEQQQDNVGRDRLAMRLVGLGIALFLVAMFTLLRGYW